MAELHFGLKFRQANHNHVKQMKPVVDIRCAQILHEHKARADFACFVADIRRAQNLPALWWTFVARRFCLLLWWTFVAHRFCLLCGGHKVRADFACFVVDIRCAQILPALWWAFVARRFCLLLWWTFVARRFCQLCAGHKARADLACFVVDICCAHILPAFVVDIRCAQILPALWWTKGARRFCLLCGGHKVPADFACFVKNIRRAPRFCLLCRGSKLFPALWWT